MIIRLFKYHGVGLFRASVDRAWEASAGGSISLPNGIVRSPMLGRFHVDVLRLAMRDYFQRRSVARTWEEGYSGLGTKRECKVRDARCGVRGGCAKEERRLGRERGEVWEVLY